MCVNHLITKYTNIHFNKISLSKHHSELRSREAILAQQKASSCTLR